jgi:ubiquinone/menaquinone biosynthesis C-methylase UbiE
MSNQHEWWQDFFSGPVLDFVYKSRDLEITLDETYFIEESLGLNPGSSILDVPCGAGRISIELARRGYQVTGIDINNELLKLAQGKARELKLDINWLEMDMRDLPWNEQFDGAVCFWSSFGYFNEADNTNFLQRVSRSLKTGASFILDTPLIETRLPEMESQERVWWPVGELLALEERTFDHETSRIESEWTFIKDGQIEKKLLSQRLYTYLELVTMLEKAGFGNHKAYSSIDGEPFEMGSTWLYMNTTKLSDPSNY